MKVEIFLRVNAINCDDVIGNNDMQGGTWRKLGAEWMQVPCNDERGLNVDIVWIMTPEIVKLGN